MYRDYSWRLSASVLSVFLLWLSLSAGSVDAQIFSLPHNDDTPGTFFGASVALENGRAVVGASNEESCGEDAGAAYIFEQVGDSGNWERVARLTPSDCEEGIFFGRAVALSGDRVIVTASREFFATQRPNTVYIFEREPAGEWVEAAQLRADFAHRAEGSFGADVALDGDRAVVTTWADTEAGVQGGAVYIFEKRGSRWERTARLTADTVDEGDVFGGSTALEGDRLAVTSAKLGDEGRGSVYIFEREDASGTWQNVARIPDVNDFFISLDLSRSRLAIGESRAGRDNSGQVRVVVPDASGNWHEQARLRSPRPYRGGAFGTEVAIHGNWIVATGFDEQLQLDTNIDRTVFAYRYNQDAAEWRFKHVMDIGSVSFGAAVDIENQTVIVGDASQDTPGRAHIIHIPFLGPSASMP